MDHRNDSCDAKEFGFVEPRFVAVLFESPNELFCSHCSQLHGDVDVRRKPRSTVDQRRLGSEQVPLDVQLGQGGLERDEYLSDGRTPRHDLSIA